MTSYRVSLCLLLVIGSLYGIMAQDKCCSSSKCCVSGDPILRAGNGTKAVLQQSEVLLARMQQFNCSLEVDLNMAVPDPNHPNRYRIQNMTGTFLTHDFEFSGSSLLIDGSAPASNDSDYTMTITPGNINLHIHSCDVRLEYGLTHSRACVYRLGSTGAPCSYDGVCYACNTLSTPCYSDGVHAFQGTSSTVYHLYSELREDGYIWVRFGLGGQQDSWTYLNNDIDSVQITTLTTDEITALSGDLQLQDIYVQSDVFFHLRADESYNPSSFRIHYLSDWSAETLVIGEGHDHTSLYFSDDTKMTIFCNASPHSSSCGQRGLPSADDKSAPLLIEWLNFDPRGPGAWASYGSDWTRNRYSWSGSEYFVWGRLHSCE